MPGVGEVRVTKVPGIPTSGETVNPRGSTGQLAVVHRAEAAEPEAVAGAGLDEDPHMTRLALGVLWPQLSILPPVPAKLAQPSLLSPTR